jgi:hypothetical protein
VYLAIKGRKGKEVKKGKEKNSDVESGAKYGMNNLV